MQFCIAAPGKYLQKNCSYFTVRRCEVLALEQNTRATTCVFSKSLIVVNQVERSNASVDALLAFKDTVGVPEFQCAFADGQHFTHFRSLFGSVTQFQPHAFLLASTR